MLLFLELPAQSCYIGLICGVTEHTSRLLSSDENIKTRKVIRSVCDAVGSL